MKALQRALGLSDVDGAFGPQTAKTVKAFQKKQHITPSGVVGPKTWTALEKVAYPLLPYRAKVVKQGSTGTAVKALQKALK
ncbi:hypothetical protein GCM10025868_36570 [Angustibacter aerolatus]|uniref:Peptidoglycan binding-like domain-containing protein n=1 Tax=Angustibacter aerolatus TaxID=1162965 RepID=A0ABQ6JJI2_9ACTN|nr:peptidoglycan-binding domain-containing protein [Angustibacter aerolatus]GMA88407.1 hypothetical protein GCM10025868_36570 [Angustibacter aerolatus]